MKLALVHIADGTVFGDGNTEEHAVRDAIANATHGDHWDGTEEDCTQEWIAEQVACGNLYFQDVSE